MGIGFALADVKALSNDNNFITLPVSAEVGYSLTPNISIYADAGYQVAFDLTPNTTCKDGSSSERTYIYNQLIDFKYFIANN